MHRTSSILKQACAESMRGCVEKKGIKKGLVVGPSPGRTTRRIGGPSKPHAQLVPPVEQVTPFRSRVYSALCEVPEGKVVTYRVLAAQIGCKSAQAVGQALKANPYAPKVPCHRVVSSDLSIGGFQGARDGTKISQKIQLLTREGVQFDDNGRVNASSVYLFAAQKGRMTAHGRKFRKSLQNTSIRKSKERDKEAIHLR